MTAIAFDALKFAKRLKEGGFAEQQAEALATAGAEFVEDNLATRWNLKELELAVQRYKKELEAALRRDIKELDTKIEQIRADLKRDIEEFRADLKRDIKELETRALPGDEGPRVPHDDQTRDPDGRSHRRQGHTGKLLWKRMWRCRGEFIRPSAPSRENNRMR